MPAVREPVAFEVTIIQDDLGHEADRRDAGERIERIGERTEDSTRRFAAAIAGALEGFVEALDRYNVGNEGQRALRDAGEIARAAGGEARAQADTPEMRELGGELRAAGEKTAEATHQATEAVRDAAVRVQETARHVKDEVRVRAEAVAESGRRARYAPGHVLDELGETWAAWKRALVTSLAMGALMLVVGLAAFVVLTIGLVQGLALLVGYVGALFLVALLYVIAAGIAYAVGRTARASATREREEHMENIREEARHVVRPMRDAFRGGRGI